MSEIRATDWEWLSQVSRNELVWYRQKLYPQLNDDWGRWMRARIASDSIMNGSKGPMRWVVPDPPTAMVGLGLCQRDIEAFLLEVAREQE